MKTRFVKKICMRFMIITLMLFIMLLLNTCIFGLQTGSVEFKYSNRSGSEQILVIEPNDKDITDFKEFQITVKSNESITTERNTISWNGYNQEQSSIVKVSITYKSGSPPPAPESFTQEIVAKAGRDNSFVIDAAKAIK